MRDVIKFQAGFSEIELNFPRLIDVAVYWILSTTTFCLIPKLSKSLLTRSIYDT